jgi:hypothetical protein
MTAVQFLVKGLPMVYWEDPYYSDLFERAKEMEKQQIIDAYNELCLWDSQQEAEQYYNETFNK